MVDWCLGDSSVGMFNDVQKKYQTGINTIDLNIIKNVIFIINIQIRVVTIQKNRMVLYSRWMKPNLPLDNTYSRDTNF